MIKVYKINNSTFAFNCPACDCLHSIDPAKWTFNGDMEKPTVSPSIRVRGGENGNDFTCHFFIKNGMIEFCGDSSHELRGQTVELPDWNN